MVDTPEDMPSTPADTPEVTPAVRPPTVPAMLQLLEARVFLPALITARRSNCSSFVTVLRFWSRSAAQQLKWARPKWDSTAGPSPAARAATAATKRGDRPMRATTSSAVVAPGGQSNVEPRGATAIDVAPVASACALQPRSTQAKANALPLQMDISSSNASSTAAAIQGTLHSFCRVSGTSYASARLKTTSHTISNLLSPPRFMATTTSGRSARILSNVPGASRW
mmetsp:Transcript_18620/g.38743  ORF Transcript_18620/g.38743 Transcript_18620/m.38743 type:complete len:225 (+) Transcript_18620:270-944(+)